GDADRARQYERRRHVVGQGFPLNLFENIQRKSLSHNVTPSLILSSTVCITSRVRSTSSRARSAASLAAASASSRSFSEVTSRPKASVPPSARGRKLNSM